MKHKNFPTEASNPIIPNTKPEKEQNTKSKDSGERGERKEETVNGKGWKGRCFFF